MPQSTLLGLVSDASPLLCDMLDGARGAVQPPIRSEIFGLQRFGQHGRSLGVTHRAAKAGLMAATFFPRLQENIRVLRQAHRYIGNQARSGYDISPAAEWLLDNFHLIESQLKEIHDGLPRSYFRTLPILQDEPLAGLPRVYGIAWAFVAHTDSAFDEEMSVQFLNAYQETRELNLREIWALPTTLRVVLVENLRRLAERVATNKAAREVANLVCDRIDSYSLATLDRVLAALNLRGVGRVFLAQMALRLQDRRATEPVVNAVAYQEWLALALPDLAATRAQQPQDQAADNLSVSNAVKSLRAIGDAAWVDIVTRTSRLMGAMQASPVFVAEDVGTQSQTLHAIERLAQQSGHSEVAVAQTLLGLMPLQAEEMGMNRNDAAALYWLDGKGNGQLTQALGLRKPWAQALHTAMRRAALPGYLSALLLGTMGLVAWLLLRHSQGVIDTIPPIELTWLTLVAALLMALPASEAVVAVINRLISESARPTQLARLAFADGIPPEHRVMVAIPGMLTSPDSARALAHRLQLHYLANPETQAQFALLTDWADASSADLPGDQALLDSAVAQVNALNVRYPRQPSDVDAGSPAPRFILLHRNRQFSDTEQRWIGWERKRGKLELLVAALECGQGDRFLDLGDSSRIANDIRYLLGVAAHPQNQPRLSVDGRNVVSGYGILQPRVVTPLPATKDATLFHWLFAGQCGIDPYSAATSEVYQDVFGEGTFTGKGLLNVHAVHAVLSSRLPQEQVLSHDLLEGSIARCAAVTDITVFEDAPFHADVAASRMHRWTRGDWQLLPFLLAPGRYGIRTINRWKMFDNLRRSLVAPASLALLLLALSGYIMSPWAALALVLAAFSAGPLMGAVAGFSPSRDDLALLHFYRQAAIDLARALWGGVWLLAQLQQQSMWALDAVTRALYRLFYSRRHLLQWTTAATAQAQALTQLSDLLRLHWQQPVISLALLAMLFVLGTPSPALAVALCLLWAASPVWTWWVSRIRPVPQEASLPLADQVYLQGIARDTWQLFERCVGPEDNFLPPDNLQVTPYDMVAHRTSPSNIGLYLLSTACARVFGWIDTLEMVTRLEATLATVEKLQHHRGHLLNWYDTTTLAPLLPMYVSTVDSGNLSGHLLAVAQACLERLNVEPTAGGSVRAGDINTRLRALAAQCERLAWAPDFAFLYHRKRHLFHIGYRVAEQTLDASFYDLLASESRLTSLLAIAKGDVPVRHWASLGRPFYAVGAEVGLRSWSGSMFEYLMPTLILNEPSGSVLHSACHTAVVEHIAYARVEGVPWGISESAYAASDQTLAYQYAPQGVPRLALRRTPADELVIAPYATALAAQVTPHTACGNFAALEALSARGPYGFIEALDYSPARQADKAPFTPVNTFMAHHQGMTIVALANVLFGGVAQRWGMANAPLEAVASLLHERAPREVSMLYAPLSNPPALTLQRRNNRQLREVLPGASALEPTHVLSNGRYSVTLRANGAGWSRWGQTGISRWRDDALRDAYGSFFYLRGEPHDALASITQHPAADPQAQYGSTFHADRMCFSAQWTELHAHTTVWVSPEDDIEFRQVELRNLSDRVVEIELISAFEVTLSSPQADEAHPAFTNLFVRAEWHNTQQGLVFERKPRLPTDKSLYAAHFLAEVPPQVISMQVQTDRQRWLGRNQTAATPRASLDPLPVSDFPQALQTGLDPVCVLAVRVRINPNAKAQLTFATTASDHSATLHAVIDKYQQPNHVQRASLMSATLTGIRLHALRISADNFTAIQSLTSALVFSLTRPQTQVLQATVSGNAVVPIEVCDRRWLWRFGISGDRPVVLVVVGAAQGLGLLRSLAQGLRLWSWGGIGCDLVVVNSEPVSYLMELQRDIAVLRGRHLAETTSEAGAVNPSCTAFHLLRGEELSAGELGTLKALARVHINADGRPLVHHVEDWCSLHEQAYERRHAISTAAVAVTSRSRLEPVAPVGAFNTGSVGYGEFGFEVNTNLRPLRPWINVLANPTFGAQIGESGAGFTWALNSRLNQLTAWSNDPVGDVPSEWFLLQDCDTMEVWSMTPSAWGAAFVTYTVTHGQGTSRISHRRNNLSVNVSWCVDPQTSVKQVHITLSNQGHARLHLRLVGMVEWIMGANRADRGTVDTALHRQRLVDQKMTALLCTQREHAGAFGLGTAFFSMCTPADETEDWTCDRREWFDARGMVVLPDHFGRQQGLGLDPCAALSMRVTLNAGESAQRVFLLGFAHNADAAKALAAQAAIVPAQQRADQVQAHWVALLGASTVKTPDSLFDVLTNRWFLYQTVACRLWSKAAFYQAGGATGFRDQLQDAMALAWASPQTLRQQIVVCASRQFVEGDVQHWWHTPTGAGVRTHFSDDLLWLPFASAHYLRVTGDNGLLDESVTFIEGAAIAPDAEDAYYAPEVSAQSASVYEHGARAIDRSLKVGSHGLPLMGGGDWNDGMNRVGSEGRGESVWLGWFLCRIVADFMPIAQARADLVRVQRWEKAARGWKTALLDQAWDGQWFKRAFFDDGQALGSNANPEARIDLIAQAWAVLSNVAPLPLQRIALASVDEHLADHQAGLVKLLEPPLVHSVPSAGYIQAYPPGVRENGGQYSHGAVWAVMAQAEFAQSTAASKEAHDIPYRTFTWLSPAHRAANKDYGSVYGLEPYVMAGDIYSHPPYVGRGGWSWYTGAAGWMHRAAIESILGLRLDSTTLSFWPCLPSTWPRAELTLRRNGRSMHFILIRSSPAEALSSTAPQNAVLLRMREPLAWPELADESCFVIPLLNEL
jgi:cyclic beta-1,2-glucan synthetase